MALKGNLRDFSMAQLLNLINLARKTGVLSVRGKASAKAYFREGKLLRAHWEDRNGRITDILVKAGKITPEQGQAIEAQARVNTDKELGLLLINAGYATQEDIIQSVQASMLEVIYSLFTWTEGEFKFEPNVLPPPDQITVPVDLENVAMEGSRRLQEWERLQDEIPDLDMALKFTERPDARLRHINLSVDEWRVISYINPRNTIRQIAQFNSMSDFQIRKIVYGLLSAGLVELVPAESRVPYRFPVGERPPVMERPPSVKRSVIQRLIERIRRL